MVLAMTSGPTRRQLLVAGTWGALASGVVLAGRLLGPAFGRRPRPMRRLVAVGTPSSIPAGGRRSLDEVIVIRDELGLAAVSSRCTHLGCTVISTARGFECPCHGSSFARDGRVVSGPATRPLEWFAVRLGEDGVLRVDLDARVSADTRLAADIADDTAGGADDEDA